MPKPTVLIGPPGVATNEAFFAQVVEWCRDVRRAARLRYIVPTARRRIEVQDAILQSCPAGEAICECRVETLDRFARTLFAASAQARLVSWRAAAIAIEMLLAAAPDDFPLLLTGRTTPFPGLVREVLRSIRELKRFAIDPDNLRRAAGGDTKAREVAELFRRYDAFLDEQGWADAQDALRVVGRQLSADPAFRQAHLGDIAWVIFDGFVEFSPSELHIVRALAACVETTLVLDTDAALPDLFPPLPRLDGQFVHRPFVGRFVPIARLAVSARQHGVEPSAPNVLSKVRYIEAATREQEVERIASTIKALILDGIAQHDIVLAVPDLGQYAGLVEEIFSAHGLPYSIQRGASLLDSPVAAAVLMLLQTPAHDFARADLVGLLRSPLVRFEQNGSALAASSVDDLARAARIFRGRRAWLDGLGRRMEFLRERSGESAYDRDEDEADAARRSPAEELRVLEQLEAPLTSALALLDELRMPRSISAHSAALRRLIARFGIERRAMELTWTDPGTSDHAQVLRELLAILDELDVIAQTGRQARLVTLDAFTELFRSSGGAAHLSTPIAPAGVEIVDIARAAERRSAVLFLAGLVEGAVPNPRARDALLAPAIRERAGLPSAARLTAASQVDVYRAIASAAETLVLSRPAVEDDRPLLKPMMLERVVQALHLAPEADEPHPTSWRGVLCAVARDDVAYPRVEALLAHAAFARSPRLRGLVHGRDVERARDAAPGTPTPYAGRLSPHVLDEVRQIYDSEHQFSAGELQTYLRCPFRFFAQRVLGLAEPTEPEEEITPLDKGTTLHKVFRDFYRRWLERGHTSVTAENMDEAFEVLASIAAQRLDELPYQGLVWRKFRERLIGSAEGGPGLLERFLEAEAAAAGPMTCRPRYFEIGFGRQRHREALDPASRDDALSVEALDRRILLHGVIDRVDTNDETNTFCVLDYKSGSDVPRLDEITHGPSIQLPVYVMAAEHLLGREYHFAAAGYFQTKDAADCGRKNWLGDATRAETAGAPRRCTTLEPAAVDEWLAREKQLIATTVIGIDEGKFAVTTLSDTQARCRACEFKHICRYRGITVRTFRGRA
jgi:ATP-dependent helicase/nuclease subunit B